MDERGCAWRGESRRSVDGRGDERGESGEMIRVACDQPNVHTVEQSKRLACKRSAGYLGSL